MTSQAIIIAIDGPSASGKGTLARCLAQRLGFALLDTGATYRSVARTLLAGGFSPDDQDKAIEIADETSRTLRHEDLADPALRTEDVSRATSKISAIPGVRAAMTALQRRFAEQPPAGFGGAVLDGRDIGTVVCPDAPVKLFLTASPETRAQRRYKELQSKGIVATYEAVLADMRERDARDGSRETAPMKPAGDAVILDTSGLGEDDVLQRALDIVRTRLPDLF